MTLERQRKTSLYVKRILSPPSKEPQVSCPLIWPAILINRILMINKPERWQYWMCAHLGSETWLKSCPAGSWRLWQVCTCYQDPHQVSIPLSTYSDSSRTGVNNEQSKISYNISSFFAQQIIFVRRYITEYCPVLEGVYSRGLNVAGLEVTMLCNLIEVGTF